MKKKIKKLLRKNSFTKKILNQHARNKRIKFSDSLYENSSPDEKTILFSSYFGRSYSCSPRQLYEYMINDPFFDDYTFIWVFHRKVIENFTEIESLKRARLVKYISLDFFRSLYEAKYWIVNSRMLDYIKKRDDQVYIQTWHGTPYKKLGSDIVTSGKNAKFTNEEI